MAIDFANAMFDIADALPQRYQFSLGEQLRRAALSIPTNIAERIGLFLSYQQRLDVRVCEPVGDDGQAWTSGARGISEAPRHC